MIHDVKKGKANLLLSFLCLVMIILPSFVINPSANYHLTNDIMSSVANSDFKASQSTSVSHKNIMTDGGKTSTVSATSHLSHIKLNSVPIDPVLEVETKSVPDSNFAFSYNETYNETFENVSQLDTIDVKAVSNRYDAVVMNFSAYSPEYQFSTALDGDVPDIFAHDETRAQSFSVPQLNNKSNVQSISIFQFSIDADSSLGGATIFGQIWTSKKQGEAIMPDIMVSNTSISVYKSGGICFVFIDPTKISKNITYTNSSAAYLFFVLINPASGSSEIIDHNGNSSTGITYVNFGSSDPINDGWGNIQPFDYSIVYNATFHMDAQTIGTTVSGSNLQQKNVFTENITRIGSSYLYSIAYNESLTESLPVYYDITAESKISNSLIVNATYASDPTSPNVQWVLYVNNPYLPNENTTMYFTIPSNYIIRSVYNESHLLTPSVDYYGQFAINNSQLHVFLSDSIGSGNYILAANSSNLFYNLVINPYRWTGSNWISTTNATMGTVVPSIENGDWIKANISKTSTDLLAIDSGVVNASLRSNLGEIYNPTYQATYQWTDSLSFNMTLDYNRSIGIYSFQFRWFNGTAAGAIATTLDILPQVSLVRLSHSPSFNALEGTNVDLVVGFINNSTNSTFSNPGVFSWKFSSQSSLGFISRSVDFYQYHYSLNLSLSSVPVLPNNIYGLNITFSESVFSISLFYNMTVYYRGGATIDSFSPVEYGSDVSFLFHPFNLTGGGSSLQTNNETSFELFYSNSTHTIPVIGYTYSFLSPNYQFTLPWDTSLILGTNQVTVRWNISGYRDSPNDNFLTTAINFTIQDQTKPVIAGYSNFTMSEQNSINYQLEWSVTDYFNGEYTLQIDKDGVFVADVSGSWGSSNNIFYNFGSLGFLKGIYLLNLTVVDSNENVAFNIFNLTIIDDQAPLATFLPDSGPISIANGSAPISWTFSDTHPHLYSISNGTHILQAGTWKSDIPIEYDLSSVPDGLLYLEIQLNDTSNNIVSSSITLDIDRTAPSDIENLSDYTFEKGNFGNHVNWTIIGNNPATYSIYQNGTILVANVTYNSGVFISLDIDDLEVLNGRPTSYNYTLIAFDAFGNSLSDTVIVTVQDTTAPVLVSRAPIGGTDVLEDGYGTDYTISWIFSDYQVDSYVYYSESIPLIVPTRWSNNISITLFIPAAEQMAIGIHNFTIEIWDQSGNLYRESILISVLDVTPPAILPVGNFDIPESSQGNYLTFSAIDEVPNNYTLSLNDIQVAWGNWTNDTPITFLLDDLSLGSYLFNLTVWDVEGLFSSTTVIVTVFDDQVPVFIQEISDFRVFENDSPITLQWTVSDQTPDHYQILVDDVILLQTNWIASGNISYTIPRLEIGKYHYQIILYDQRGLTSSSLFVLTVKPTGTVETNEIADLGLSPVVYEGDVDSVQGIWTESGSGVGISDASIFLQLVTVSVEGFPSGVTVYTLTSVTNVTGGYYIDLNYSNNIIEGIAVGHYLWNITFSKQQDGLFYEPKSAASLLSILPQDLQIDIQYPSTLIQESNYSIVVTVSYNPRLTGSTYQLDTIVNRVSKGQGVRGISIILIIEFETSEGTSSIRKQGTTDENGRVIITLTPSETNDILSVSKMDVNLENAAFASSESRSIRIDNPDISVTVTNFNFLSEVQTFIQQYWMYILTGLLLTIAFSAILVRERKKKRQRRATIYQELEYAAEEIAGINSIQAIILKHSETGIPFYYKTYEESQNAIDPSLISSLTTAISTFLSELQAESKGFEIMERQGISLTSHRGECSDFIVISTDNLPAVLMELIPQAHKEIESKYIEDISNPVLVQEIEEDEIDRLLIENSIKVDLKGLLKIDTKRVKSVKTNSKINRNVRYNIDFLEEFNFMVKEATVPITLSSIMEFLISKELGRDIASRLIIVGHTQKAIVPSTEDHPLQILQ